MGVKEEFEQQWGVSLPEATSELDEQLCVVSAGRVMCCVGLTASLYFEGSHTPEGRERLIRTFERYRDAVGDALVWGANPKTGRPRKVAGSDLLEPRKWVQKIAPQDTFELTFHGGKHQQDASGFFFKGVGNENSNEEWSAVEFGMPLSWAAARGEGAYQKLILDACELLQPIHGYAGLGIATYVGESGKGETMPFVVPLARRFRGLDLDFAFLQTPKLEDQDAIKGINWLTVLSDAWAERVGGREALAEALGAECPIHEYDGGLVIQAGPHPQFGDVNRDEPMPHYERVAKVLKPIRAKEMRALAPWAGMKREETAEWLARFDR